MQHVDHVHQILRRAVAAGRREEAGDLISPRAVKGMLHHRHQLDVREIHLAQVFGERPGQLAIAHRSIVFFEHPLPRSDVHLVDSHRRGEGVPLCADAHPLLILPVVVEVPHDRCSVRGRLRVNADGIGFVHPISVVARADVVLVLRTLPHARDECFPDSGRAARLEPMRVAIPAVEVAHDAHRLGVRGPDGEHRPPHALAFHDMRSELFPQPVMTAFVEEVIVPIG